MKSFIHQIGTKVYFGENQLVHLGGELANFGSNVLLVYGGGSIKKNGLYNQVIDSCEKSNLNVFELSGVEPNPRIETVRKGIKICKEHNIDVVLAVGGGSTNDCSKAIAAGAFVDVDPWEMILDSSIVKEALPIVTVITLAATGSEMNGGSVITNWETNDKLGFGSPILRPRVTFEDPTLTYSVSKFQTAAGTVDIMSHVFEQYFCKERAYMSNRMAEAILKTCIHFGPIAIAEPTNYEARANLLWSSSWALNDFLREAQPVAWTVHPIEHELSAYYDVTHGAGLAILTPHWMRKVLSQDTVHVFVEYGVNVWGISDELDSFEIANQAIDKTEQFFKSLGIPMTLQEVGITTKDKFDVMAQKSSARLKGVFVDLTKDDVEEILNNCY